MSSKARVAGSAGSAAAAAPNPGRAGALTSRAPCGARRGVGRMLALDFLPGILKTPLPLGELGISQPGPGPPLMAIAIRVGVVERNADAWRPQHAHRLPIGGSAVPSQRDSAELAALRIGDGQRPATFADLDADGAAGDPDGLSPGL